MKTKIYNLIILDASGSMTSIEKQAVDGVNETVQTIREAQKKHDDQEHFVTLVSFNSSETKKIYDGEPASEVKELSQTDYTPNCSTPLYDAMGFSITELQKKIEKDDKVLVTVITDGEENSSHEYDGKAISSLVDKLKNEGWVFAYIGANQDVMKMASRISITNCIDFDATGVGTSAMFAREKKARLRFFDRLSKAHNEVLDCMAEDYYDEDTGKDD